MILTANLCCALQKVYKDLVDSFEGIDFIKRTLQNRRSTEEWKDNDYGPYIMAENLANSINVDLQMPRITAHEQGRYKVPTDSIDDYFRQAVWYPNLDTIISAIEYRFKTHSIIVNKMVPFIPGQMSYFECADVKDCV